MSSLNRSVIGLIYQDAFTSLSPSWTTTGNGWAILSTDPTLVVFDRSSIIMLSPGAGSDSNGVREAFTIVGKGAWWLFYGAGNGSGPWMNQIAQSLDHGLTWTKYGPTSFRFNKTSDLNSGTWGGRDIGSVELHGGQFYLRSGFGQGNTGAPNFVPSTPYQDDVFVFSQPLGQWVWQRTELALGSAGQFDDNTASINSVVQSGNTYYAFYSGQHASTWTFGLATASLPEGPWTKQGQIISDHASENPRVFFHPSLNTYVMISNEVVVADGKTEFNAIRANPASLTDWTGHNYKYVQRICTADGATAIGQLNEFRTEQNAIVMSSNGFVACAFDTDPTDSNHNGRKIRYAVAEPSPTALQFNGTGPATVRHALINSNFNAEFIVEIPTGAGSFCFDYRAQGLSGDSYRIVCTIGSGIVLQKSSGGVYSNIATSSGSLLFIVTMLHRIRLVISGNSHQVWLDGEQQINATDSAFSSGSTIGFAATGTLDGRVRNFHMRNSDTITINGCTTGQIISLRSAGIPYQQVTATGAQVTLTNTHWPMESIEVNNISCTFPDNSFLWGGDTVNIGPL